MTNQLTVVEPTSINLSTLTIPELRTALADAMTFTLSGLIQASKIVGELERRGENLSDLRDSTIPNLRKIACGQLLPEVYVRLFCKPSILNRVASLPIPDQEKIAAGKPVEVYLLGDAAGAELILQRVEDMESATAQQVFASGKIRSKSEQVAWLRARMIPRPRPAGPNVSLDRKRKGIYCESHSFVSLADLRDYVSQLEA